ncbi:MAG: cytochrome-c peroxidase [Gammaproteobacteria bacterium]
MNFKRLATVVGGAALAFVFWAPVLSTTSKQRGDEPIKPIPLAVELDPARVALGELLFHEPRLSGDDSVSCASCHSLQTAGVDLARFSKGIGGQKGGRNAPTVFNVGFNYRQLWDARSGSLEDQIEKVIHNKKVMGSNWPQIIGKLKADERYGKLFEQAYADGVSAENVKHALASFERSLITPNFRFDRYLRGDDRALSAEELRGYELFKETGCISCHQGVNVGGNMLQRFGVMRRLPGTDAQNADTGRFKVTGDEADKFVFRVPSLRLAARTPPYFHDGSAATLEEAVDVMINLQVRQAISDSDKNAIVKFIKSLVGRYKGKPL